MPFTLNSLCDFKSGFVRTVSPSPLIVKSDSIFLFVSISLITTSKIINAYVDDVLVSSISANRFGSIKTQLVFNVPSMATYTIDGGIILNWVEL